MSVVQRRSRVAVVLVALFLLAYLLFSLFPFYLDAQYLAQGEAGCLPDAAAVRAPPAHAGQLRAPAERGPRGDALLPQQHDRGYRHGGAVHRRRRAGRVFPGALSGAGAAFGDGVHPDEPDVPDGAAAYPDLHLLRAHAAARYPRGGDSGACRHRPAVQRLAAEGLHRYRAARDRGGGGDRRQQPAWCPGAHRQPDDRTGPW